MLGSGSVLLASALLLLSACANSTAPDAGTPAPSYKPVRTPEPAIGSFHVVLTTTGTNLDPNGYTLLVDSTAQPVRDNDTAFVTNVVLGGHKLRLDDVATNCVPDSASSISLFLTSPHDTAMQISGSQPRTLARSRGFARPTWSPDGQTIAFANTCPDHRCPSAVLYVSADGARKGVLMDDAYSPSL